MLLLSTYQWLPSGDAFRISNLQRLENETLPTFFRHRRFQSLVRQLNFYNFRKVNRERTFWVYRHQLFHRDRPNELHLLRRRTCPGVDGRKQRSENDGSTSRSQSPKPASRRSYYSNDDQSDESVALSSGKKKRKARYTEEAEMKKQKRKQAVAQSALDFDNKAIPADECENDEKSQEIKEVKIMNEQDSPSSVINSDLITHIVPPESDEYKGPSGLPKRAVSPSIFGDNEKKERSSSFEQSVLVSRVSRKLEEHAKRAAAAKGIGSKRRSGTVTPPFSSDTMKYHALTYDDEIEIFDSERGCVVERQQRSEPAVPTDSDESASIISNDEEHGVKGLGKRSVSFHHDCNKNTSIPPVQNDDIVSEIVKKLHGWTRQSAFASKVDGQLAAAIAGFCMITNPRDANFEDKCIELMFQCGSLVTEFRSYKAALLPGCLLLEGLAPKKSPRLEVQIKQLFSGDKINTVRVMKVFLLNSLEDLVNNSSLFTNVGMSKSETESLNHSYQIWLTCLRHSS